MNKKFIKILAAVLLWMVGIVSSAQSGSRTLIGVVRDTDGKGLPGAVVYLKDKPTVGTSSDKYGNFELKGCVLYTSCEPCPMCLGAIYWSRVDRVVYAGTQNDAADAGFDDSFIYKEIALPMQSRTIPFKWDSDIKRLEPFTEWKLKTDKIEY